MHSCLHQRYAIWLSKVLLQGRISSWIEHEVGLDPANLYPSVRCGLEGALLTALAKAQKLTLAKLLSSSAPATTPQNEATDTGRAVLVNGLLDCDGDIEACRQEAADLVAQGYTALKLKVLISKSGCHSLPLLLSLEFCSLLMGKYP